MKQLIINDNIKFDTIKNLIDNKDFYVVFSNELSRNTKDSTDITTAGLDSLFEADVVELVFVAKFVIGQEDSEIYIGRPDSTVSLPCFPEKYDFVAASTVNEVTQDMTVLFFKKAIEAHGNYPQFNMLSLVYCEKYQEVADDNPDNPPALEPLDNLSKDYTVPDPEEGEDEGVPHAQPATNPFATTGYNSRILAQVRPAPTHMNKKDTDISPVPKLEMLIEF